MKIRNNNKWKEIDTKIRTCYYFDDIIRIKDFDLGNIVIDGKSCKNILVYNISQKSLIFVEPLYIRFDKVNGFIRLFDGTRYLVIFGPEKYDAIFNRIRHLIGLKTVITYVLSYNYPKTKVDLYDSLSLEKSWHFTML